MKSDSDCGRKVPFAAQMHFFLFTPPTINLSLSFLPLFFLFLPYLPVSLPLSSLSISYNCQHILSHSRMSTFDLRVNITVISLVGVQEFPHYNILQSFNNNKIHSCPCIQRNYIVISTG